MRHRVFYSFMICLLISAALCLPAFAANDPGTLWLPSSYPADISYAYCTGADGDTKSWEIGIVNGNETRKAELAELFPDCILTFTECVVSFSERSEILNTLLSSEEDGIISGMLVQDSEHILLIAENSKAAKLSALYEREYGSIVVVSNEKGEIPGTVNEFSIDFRLFIVILAAVAFVIIFVNRYTNLKKERLDRDV